MNLIINILLISGLLIIIVETSPLSLLKTEILPYWVNSGTNILMTPIKNLVLIGGPIGETKDSIVWKGRLDDKFDVALKIASYMAPWIKETQTLKALNAIDDPNIEKHDIPRVYYHGLIFNRFPAIAMTLFDGSLNDLYERYKGNISESQILFIFKQAVQALDYIHSKNVIHNNIQPENLFLRGSEVFIGDFDEAAIDGSNRSLGYSNMFASTGFYENRHQYPMDDLESLVFSIWYIASVPLGITNETVKQPEGQVFMKVKKAGKARERVLEKCKHFKDPKVQKAFEAIFVNEMLSGRPVPNYKLIIEILDKAIIEISGNSAPVQFKWLTGRSASGSSQV